MASEYHGQVTFNDLPIPGVTVTATQGSKKVSTVTDIQGAYSFPDLADGNWSIQLEMLGFAPLVDLYRRSGATAGHDPSTLHVTMGGIGLIARRSQDAKDAFYPYWLETIKYGAKARGWSIPSRRDYDEATRGAQSILAGSPNEIAERLISVGQLVGADRYALQMDWAGVPHDRVMTAIELLGTEVLPQVRAAFAETAVSPTLR